MNSSITANRADESAAKSWDRAGRSVFGERWAGVGQPPRLLSAAQGVAAPRRPADPPAQAAATWDRVGRRMFGAAWKGF